MHFRARMIIVEQLNSAQWHALDELPIGECVAGVGDYVATLAAALDHASLTGVGVASWALDDDPHVLMLPELKPVLVRGDQ